MREIVGELSLTIRTITILLCKSQSVSISHDSKKRTTYIIECWSPVYIVTIKRTPPVRFELDRY